MRLLKQFRKELWSDVTSCFESYTCPMTKVVIAATTISTIGVLFLVLASVLIETFTALEADVVGMVILAAMFIYCASVVWLINRLPGR